MSLDFASAKHYALRRLEHELSPLLTYHCLAHTRDEVIPAAEQLAALEDVTGEARLLLLTAASFHDLGYLETRAGHEEVSVRMAGEILPGLGYSPGQIETIGGMIRATKLPQTPRTLPEEIMADADFDVLGGNNFWLRVQALRDELAALGAVFSDEQWYADQLKFVSGHRYFTASARRLRDDAKHQFMAELARRLEATRASALPARQSLAP
jgi:uncharacterized protein